MSGKRKIVILGTTLALLAGVLAFGKFQIDRIERQAVTLAETGRAVIQLYNELAAGLGAGDLERVAASYAPREGAPAEGGWQRRLRSDRDGIRVYDWEVAPGTSPTVRERYRGLLDGVSELTQSKLKLDRIESIDGPDEVTARGVLWLRGVTVGGELFESQARLRTHLDRSEGDWRIGSQELLEGVTVVGAGAGFGDVSEEAGLDFRARFNPAFETPEWELKRFGIAKYASAGASAVDYDGDGWYDIFLADGAGFRLYRNLSRSSSGSLSFRDVTAEAGLPVDYSGVQVGLFADFDNDGDRDLFLGRISADSRLYRNEGDGTFVDVTEGNDFGKEFVTVAAAGDYDGDGDLDLYVGRYLDPRVDLPTTLFYTRNGQGNSLFRNDGGLRFTDVTAETGVREGGLTLGVAFGDVDLDGDLDLHVANDFGRNALFRNVGGGFEDVSEATGTLDFGYGMSSSFGDVDNDGDLDLYVSNVHSGQRWYGQAPTLYQYLLTSLRQGTFWEDLPLYREVLGYAGSDWKAYGDKVVKGNSLLLNDGDGHFTDVAETAGANPFGWYWGSTFLDYDNDGRLDVYAANGWITAPSHDDL